jgi:hypothetical protein
MQRKRDELAEIINKKREWKTKKKIKHRQRTQRTRETSPQPHAPAAGNSIGDVNRKNREQDFQQYEPHLLRSLCFLHTTKSTTR